MKRRPQANRRVVVALHEPTLGGATLSVLRAVPLLEERGWRFSFWVPSPSPAFDELAGRGYEVGGAPRYLEYSVRSWRLPPGPIRRTASVPSYIREFRRFLHQQRPALVHANSIINIAEALIARRAGYPVLLHVHEMLPSALRGELMKRRAWRALDEIVAVSKASAERMAVRGQVPRVVYEAAPLVANPVEIRLRPEPFTVGTVAVVSSRKGSDLFVEAAERLLGSDTPFQFEMVGAPSDAVERDWARELLLRANALGVRHDTRANVFERLRQWDAFVLPSRADPCPISLLEAMGAGVPVIGTRVDGIAEQIAPGCGRLAAPGDAADLARAISEVAALSADERRVMGQAARRRVASHFSLETQAAGLHDAYLSAVAERSADPVAS